MSPHARALAAALLAPAAAFLGLGGTAGCGAQDPKPSAAITRDVVRAYIDERGGGEMAFEDPASDEVVVLALDRIHDEVRVSEGGRQVVCVDFRAEDGTAYDVDYYVGGDPRLEVQDVVIHRAGGETVLSDAQRARLEEKG